MTPASSQIAIDQIVSSCNGDVHGALRALLLVNEHLEIELARLRSIIADRTDRRPAVLQ